VELEGGVLVIRRIHVKLRLRAEERHRETTARVHEIFAAKCPVYLTLRPAIEITTSLEFSPE
jgi:uncharacterized OsmC-like protein